MHSSIIFFTLIIGVRGGFPFARTDKECRAMLPSKLRSIPRTNKNLFEVSVSDNIYTNDMHHVTVTIQNTTASRPIIGILLQPRLVDCSGPNVDHNVGEFELLVGNDFLDYLDCNGKEKSAVVNKEWRYSQGRSNVEVNFKIRKSVRWRIKFRATIVTKKNEVWVENDSEVIRYLKSSPNSESSHIHCPRTSRQFVNKPLNSGCIHSKTLSLIALCVFLVFSN